MLPSFFKASTATGIGRRPWVEMCIRDSLGLGIMLAANEVPRIAQQFGLDSSVRVNVMSVVHATTTAVNLTRGLARSVK